MVWPALIGVASRALVGNGARAAAMTEARGAATAASASSRRAAPTRASIKGEADRLVSARAASRASTISGGLVAAAGLDKVVDMAQTRIDGAVGYFMEKASFETMLALNGMGYALDNIEQSLMPEEARMAPNSAVGENYSDLHEVLNGRVGYSLTFKGAMDNVRAAAVSVWKKFGYMVNRSMVPPRLDVMSAYSYWRIEDITFQGTLPQDGRMELAAAFERGVTVWTDLNLVGSDPTNTPRSGVSY